MALSYYHKRRLPLLKTPRNWYDKPELLTINDSSNSLLNRNWLTKPSSTNSYGYAYRQDDFPTLESNRLQNRNLLAHRSCIESNQQSRINSFNSTTQINRTRINHRNNLEFGDFLLPTLQPTSPPESSRPSYGNAGRPTSTRSGFTSNNNEFPVVTQNLFRLGQLTHHLKNWERLPTSISNRINDMVLDIHPPLGKELLTTQLTEHAKTFGNNIKETITQHLKHELSNITNTLNNLNPTDVKEASKIAHTRLKTRLGHKFNRHSLNFSVFEKEVGRLNNNNENTGVVVNRIGNSNERDSNEFTNAVNEIAVSTNNAILNTDVNIANNTVARLDTYNNGWCRQLV